MRGVLRFAKLFAIAACVVGLWFWYIVSIGPWLELKSLRRDAEKNLDPTELQTWATKLASEHPRGSIRLEQDYGDAVSAHVLAGLRKIRFFSDGMHIYTRDGRVFIRGDGKGGPFFQIGPPSSTAPNKQRFVQWKPGIYLVEP